MNVTRWTSIACIIVSAIFSRESKADESGDATCFAWIPFAANVGMYERSQMSLAVIKHLNDQLRLDRPRALTIVYQDYGTWRGVSVARVAPCEQTRAWLRRHTKMFPVATDSIDVSNQRRQFQLRNPTAITFAFNKTRGVKERFLELTTGMVDPRQCIVHLENSEMNKYHLQSALLDAVTPAVARMGIPLLATSLKPDGLVFLYFSKCDWSINMTAEIARNVADRKILPFALKIGVGKYSVDDISVY